MAESCLGLALGAHVGLAAAWRARASTAARAEAPQTCYSLTCDTLAPHLYVLFVCFFGDGDWIHSDSSIRPSPIRRRLLMSDCLSRTHVVSMCDVECHHLV